MNFNIFFLVMFIVELATVITCLFQCIGSLSEKLSCCLNFGACTSLCACTAGCITYILGTYWRFSHPGKVCSGDFYDPDKAKPSDSALLPKGGLCLLVVLIIFWIVLGLVCCIVPVLLCCCATALGLSAAS